MARTPLKQIAVPIADLIAQLDLSALAPGEEAFFEAWLIRSVNMQITIETALRRGHQVQVSSSAHGRQADYLIQIVDSGQ